MKIINSTTILFFLFLVLSVTFISLNFTLAQTNLEQKNKAEALLTILDNNNKTIRSTIENLETKNLSVPAQVKTTYNEGIARFQETISFMNQDKYNEVNMLAIETMQKFEETLRLLDHVLPMESTETEKIAEEMINLKANITRISQHIQRIENLTAKVRILGYNTSEIDNQLLIVKNQLSNAKQRLNTLNFAGATEELNKVIRLLKEIEEYCVQLTNQINVSNIEDYVQDATKRVTKAKTSITASTTLTPETKEEAITALNNSEESLANAQDSIDNNNVDEAIKELEEAKKWEEESNQLITAVATTSTASTPTQENTLTVTTTSTSK